MKLNLHRYEIGRRFFRSASGDRKYNVISAGFKPESAPTIPRAETAAIAPGHPDPVLEVTVARFVYDDGTSRDEITIKTRGLGYGASDSIAALDRGGLTARFDLSELEDEDVATFTEIIGGFDRTEIA